MKPPDIKLTVNGRPVDLSVLCARLVVLLALLQPGGAALGLLPNRWTSTVELVAMALLAVLRPAQSPSGIVRAVDGGGSE